MRVNRLQYRCSWAFTLVELLVVIAVIVVLMSLLIPSLAQARERAKTTVCMSNLRQITIAYTSYVSTENNSHNWCGNVYPGSSWMYCIQPYVGANNLRGANRPGGLLAGNVMVCPDATESSPSGRTIPGIGGQVNNTFWGSAHLAWDSTFDTNLWNKAVHPNHANLAKTSSNPGGLADLNGNQFSGTSPGYRGSYGINSWMDIRYQKPTTGGFGHVTLGWTGPMTTFSRVDEPTVTPLFADSVWVENDPGGPPGVAPNDDVLASNAATTETGDGFEPAGHHCIARHYKGINMSHVDGSVSYLRLTDLWHVPWYNGMPWTDLNARMQQKIATGR